MRSAGKQGRRGEGGEGFREFDFEIKSSSRSKQPREVGWKYWEVKRKKGGTKIVANVKGK